MRLMIMAGAALLAACGAPPSAETREAPSAPRADVAPLQLKAADGVTVFATHYPVANAKALILLFHQAGSGKGEYAMIAPQLNAAGYAALAIDQRSGGDLFGKNETAAALGHEADYLDAKRDLEAALAWAETQKLPVILWGSSYSSGLIFPVAAEHPGAVKALLAFSPGEYFDDKHLIATAAAKLTVPVFVTSSGSGGEVATAKPIVDAIPAAQATVYVPKAGAHGSSTLIAAKNDAGAEANWRAVLAFLKRVAP